MKISFNLNPGYILAPAKINLFLRVDNKRLDGHHDLFSIMYIISLYDTIVFSFKKKSRIVVTCNNPYVFRDKYNLIYLAVCLFFRELEKYGISIRVGINIHIYKNIPVGSGFGGGSSDAASMLLLLNERFGNLLSIDILIAIAKKIGSDVPFFVFGKSVIAAGTGSDIAVFTCNVPRFALLVCPKFAVSTRWVYENIGLDLILRLTRGRKKLTSAILNVINDNYSGSLYNDLENVVGYDYDTILGIKSLLLKVGALGAMMTGSGSGVFGLFDNLEGMALARNMLYRCKVSKGWSIYMVELLSHIR